MQGPSKKHGKEITVSSPMSPKYTTTSQPCITSPISRRQHQRKQRRSLMSPTRSTCSIGSNHVLTCWPSGTHQIQPVYLQSSTKARSQIQRWTSQPGSHCQVSSQQQSTPPYLRPSSLQLAHWTHQLCLSPKKMAHYNYACA